MQHIFESSKKLFHIIEAEKRGKKVYNLAEYVLSLLDKKYYFSNLHILTTAKPYTLFNEKSI